MITASICTIGDEILIGQVVDTNSSKIALSLNSIGVKVNKMISIGDNNTEIKSTIEECLNYSSIVIITGGLGPTKDDITKNSLAELTNAKNFVCNEQQLKIIYKILNARKIPISDINLAQASVPDTCTVIINEYGTAPIMKFVIPEKKYGHKCMIISMPGVPFETETALPKVTRAIQEEFKLNNIIHKTICTFGIAESTLAKKIEQWENNLPKDMHLAYLPNPIYGVKLRLSIYDTDNNNEIELIDNEIEKLKKIIGNAIYGYGDTSLQEVIGNYLHKNSLTVSTAESCTGGFLASLFTSISGSSKYYYGGVVSYDNSVKINTLGVNSNIINKYGAVSKECVEQMAIGVRKLTNTDYAIATSGIAGPNGGTKDKPVGTVWIAVADKDSVISKEMVFKGDRLNNIQRFASNALNLLRLKLSE
jgi:competence/damage-inducible protein CinA C-terminal domain